MQTEKGQSIEDASMAVIEKEIGEHQYDQMQWPIVRRVIHSTADFDFAGKQAIKFSPDSIKNGINYDIKTYRMLQNLRTFMVFRHLLSKIIRIWA